MKLGLLRGMLCAAVAVAGVVVPAGNAGAAQNVVVTQVTGSAAYWTSARMRAATPLGHAAPKDDPGPPPGTPTANSFTGVPTVGALFFTSTGGSLHFCTASTVWSLAGNLVLTAAHCLAGGAANVSFVPDYHDGVAPFGTWPVRTVSVAPGWASGQDPNLDFAFLTVTSPDGHPLQAVTGANFVGVDRGYDHDVTVLGYPNTADEPIECRTRSFEFIPNQLQFNCHGYTDGTSGGPWFTGFDPHRGTGTIIGDIGGYHTGGDYEYTSYSPYFDTAILKLYACAQAAR